MPKYITEEEYLIAYNILAEKIEQIDPHENDFLISNEISAEKALIKTESFELLSNEAKEVIMLIVSQPNEILKLIRTPAKGFITKNSVLKHISKIFHSEFIAKQIIKEISEWANQL